jgi:dsDNA-specific endonuclease/ATPase MutS2
VGELIDFQEYVRQKSEREEREIAEDISRLKAEIKEILDEMESPDAPYIFHSGYEELIPVMSQIQTTLDGYVHEYYDSKNPLIVTGVSEDE